MVTPGHGLGYEAGIQDCLEGGKTSQVQRPKQKRAGSHRKLALKQLLEERTDQNGIWAGKG